MPFTIVRNDITVMKTDAIVNTANPEPVIGSGVDCAIHQAAGPGLLEARKKIGRISVGQAAVTPAFDLPSRYVIHTVSPCWQGGGLGEEELLKGSYQRTLELALEQGCESVAFPLLSAGNYGFPKEIALRAAVAAFGSFLLDHELTIYLVVFEQAAVKLSEMLLGEIRRELSEELVQRKLEEEYFEERDNALSRPTFQRREECRPKLLCQAPAPDMSAPVLQSSKEKSLSQILKETDAGFSETLLRLIDRAGKSDPEVYKKANISRKLFSKIRSNPAYQPKKQTALALAVALELSLEETKDLIGRAGYALSPSSKGDLIITYCIEKKIYDLFEINSLLFDYDQVQLGGGDVA